ncbi:MAG: hypothetical protein R2939_16880 [Kofleriaceae bacterium]
MATKKTPTATPAAAKKTAKPAKAKSATAAARHPLARLKAQHGSKADLAAKLAAPLASTSDDVETLKGRLAKASNRQLLHLAAVVDTVQKKFGGRAQLITAIGAAANKTKDQAYLTKLGTLSLPRLLDLATSGQRRAKLA